MIYICGCVLNCEKYLEKVFDNIKKIGSLFSEYKIIISYDNSTDKTLEILKKYEEVLPVVILINERPISRIRTKNISDARNLIIDYIKDDNNSKYKYFIMLDMDDINISDINIDNLKYHMSQDYKDWDALSFNRADYYDIWALSIEPFILSCWHWENSWIDSINIVQKTKKYITLKLSTLPKDQLLHCQSAFNGFSIYRINKFINCRYEWNINKNIGLLENEVIENNLKAVNKPFIIIDTEEYISEENYVERYPYNLFVKHIEDCEHRYFHLSAIKNNGAKIRISPLKLFET
jgi:hypothetical protein